MRAIVQRVSSATVRVAERVVGQIGRGLLVYLAVMQNDQQSDADYIAEKIAHLRIFTDRDGKLNLDALQTSASVLVVSNFTIGGDVRRGRRPSFDAAARGPVAEQLYEYCTSRIASFGLETQRGIFGAHMKIESVADGPVNILLDSKKVF